VIYDTQVPTRIASAIVGMAAPSIDDSKPAKGPLAYRGAQGSEGVIALRKHFSPLSVVAAQ
jgi:hypothetical protein